MASMWPSTWPTSPQDGAKVLDATLRYAARLICSGGEADDETLEHSNNLRRRIVLPNEVEDSHQPEEQRSPYISPTLVKAAEWTASSSAEPPPGAAAAPSQPQSPSVPAFPAVADIDVVDDDVEPAMPIAHHTPEPADRAARNSIEDLMAEVASSPACSAPSPSSQQQQPDSPGAPAAAAVAVAVGVASTPAPAEAEHRSSWPGLDAPGGRSIEDLMAEVARLEEDGRLVEASALMAKGLSACGN